MRILYIRDLHGLCLCYAFGSACKMVEWGGVAWQQGLGYMVRNYGGELG